MEKEDEVYNISWSYLKKIFKTFLNKKNLIHTAGPGMSTHPQVEIEKPRFGGVFLLTGRFSVTQAPKGNALRERARNLEL